MEGKQRALTVSERMPRDAWDSHMHVVDPTAYPLSANALYKPNQHTFEDAMNFENSVGVENIVIVQPSIYGYDNSCMLDAMRTLGPKRARGVVSFNPTETSLSTLQDWHQLGVRGVRINLQSVGKIMGQAELETVMKLYAEAVRPLDWVIQVYLPMHMIPLLERIVPQLGLRICIDHIGRLAFPGQEAYQRNKDPYSLPEFQSLVRLLKGGQTFVKLSAPYRISKSQDDWEELRPIAQEILKVAGESRVVFATDWPHTRFEGLDIRPWIELLLELCEKKEYLKERLFRGNAQDLWGVQI
ncbi:hypothetical protein F5B20DRAFT_568800 [Whalleya microplaca]|nr:hypothetical protein F5B20DRAFT_568800 [Whalleya microplaca]